MAASTSELALLCWVHPAMKVPFSIDSKLQIGASLSEYISDLMDRTEALMENMCEEAGQPFQIHIQVLWNLRDKTKTCQPQQKVSEHFVSGDTFGIYGDVMPVPRGVQPIPEEKKLPVTILTGFLGAGKTTLLNYILQDQKDKKIAVIENEFGEISIDDALLKQDKLAMAEKVIVLDNGCMCCTVRGDLEAGLRQILGETEKGNKIDQVIIETTGMADPVPIVRTFMSNPSLTAQSRLDGVVTVADAKHILQRLDDQVEAGKVNEAYQQVAFCDKLLLNKLDLVSTEDAISVKDRLRSINAFAKILPAVRGRVKVAELTNLRAHDLTNFVNTDIEKEASFMEEELTSKPRDDGHGEHGHSSHGDGHGDGNGDCNEDHGHGGHGGGHESTHGTGHGTGHLDAHGHAVKKSRHDSRVNSFAVVREGEIVADRLSKWMQSLGSFPPERGIIYRIKGILAIRGHPYKHVFHAVMDISDEDDAGLWQPGEKKVTKIVFIGKGLDRKFIEDGFHSIFFNSK